jgi:hypothetical protein
MNMYNIEVGVHKKLDGGAYRVKVEILNEDILMYINGTRVFPPNEEHPEWSVQTPGIPKSKDKAVSFDGKSPLWKEYKQACIDTVQEYIRTEKLDTGVDETVFDMSDEEFNKQHKKELDKIPL